MSNFLFERWCFPRLECILLCFWMLTPWCCDPFVCLNTNSWMDAKKLICFGPNDLFWLWFRVFLIINFIWILIFRCSLIIQLFFAELQMFNCSCSIQAVLKYSHHHQFWYICVYAIEALTFLHVIYAHSHTHSLSYVFWMSTAVFYRLVSHSHCYCYFFFIYFRKKTRQYKVAWGAAISISLNNHNLIEKVIPYFVLI